MVNVLPPVPGTGQQTQQGGVDYMQGQADGSQVGSTMNTNTTQDPNVVTHRVGALCYNYLNQQIMCDGSGVIGGGGGTEPPVDTGGGRNFQQECEAMGNVWDTATQTCNSPAGTPNPADQCPEGQHFVATLGCVNDGPGPCPEGTYQDPWGRGCLPVSYPYDPPRGGDCPEGQMIGPDGVCVPIDENNYILQPGDCPQGQVKNEFGECWDPSGFEGGGPEDGWESPTLPPPSDYSNLPGSPDPTVPEDIYGVSPVDPNVEDMDFDQVRDFIDASIEESNRYLDPMDQYEKERFQQELLNKGIDPDSDAGRKALNRMQMGQNDRRSKQTFDAMQYGQQLQSQMHGQALSESQLANVLVPVIMQLEQRGHEFDIEALFKGDQINWDQLMDTTDVNYREYQSFIDQERYWDAIALLLAGGGPAPGYQTFSGTGNLSGYMPR